MGQNRAFTRTKRIITGLTPRKIRAR